MKAGGRRQKAECRGQRAEGRRQRVGGRRQEASVAAQGLRPGGVGAEYLHPGSREN